MADDYIQVRVNGSTNLTGFKLTSKFVLDLDLFLGIDTTELSIPSTTTRALLPTSGLKSDPTFTIDLIDDGLNKAFSIDNIGNETALNIISTADQLNFIKTNLISAKINATYVIYNDWLNLSFTGLLTIRARASGDSFFNTIQIIATLKEGDNLFSS
jgi:hypothetical protein